MKLNKIRIVNVAIIYMIVFSIVYGVLLTINKNEKQQQIEQYEQQEQQQETQKQQQQQIDKQEQQKQQNNENYEEYVEIITNIIWCEDRTSLNNAKDVLSTIINRAKSTNIKDMATVATDPYQFSCYNSPKIIASQRTNKLDIVMKEKIKQLVLDAINGNFTITHNGTHYYAYKKIRKPRWAKKMRVVKKNDKHIFLVNLTPRG